MGFFQPIYERTFKIRVHGYDHETGKRQEGSFEIDATLTVGQDDEDATVFDFRVDHGSLIIVPTGAQNCVRIEVDHFGKADKPTDLRRRDP